MADSGLLIVEAGMRMMMTTISVTRLHTVAASIYPVCGPGAGHFPLNRQQTPFAWVSEWGNSNRCRHKFTSMPNPATMPSKQYLYGALPTKGGVWQWAAMCRSQINWHRAARSSQYGNGDRKGRLTERNNRVPTQCLEARRVASEGLRLHPIEEHEHAVAKRHLRARQTRTAHTMGRK
eukprot:6193220-Pleurochrysis_carterae.AAC.4